MLLATLTLVALGLLRALKALDALGDCSRLLRRAQTTLIGILAVMALLTPVAFRAGVSQFFREQIAEVQRNVVELQNKLMSMLPPVSRDSPPVGQGGGGRVTMR